MAQILIPTRSIDDWKHLLAKPNLHWKAGYSAMTLARAWESARQHGFPAEVAAILRTAQQPGWEALRLLLAIPEYQVALPGGQRPSQTDLLALARSQTGLVVVAVEGKVDESLGPTVGEKRREDSAGVSERLSFLLTTLGLTGCPDDVRYQLLHRTVSALLVARDFAAEGAVMLIHSFSPSGKWFADFAAFGGLFGQTATPGQLVPLGVYDGIPLWIGWCAGDQQFRAELPSVAV